MRYILTLNLYIVVVGKGSFKYNPITQKGTLSVLLTGLLMAARVKKIRKSFEVYWAILSFREL